MIIRSQDKKAIVNLNNIDSICIETNHYGCDVASYNGLLESCVKLGEYSTEEKAINVLDMIQKRYSEFCCNEFCSVFEMPADKDVEV